MDDSPIFYTLDLFRGFLYISLQEDVTEKNTFACLFYKFQF